MLTKIITYIVLVIIWIGLTGIHSEPLLIIFAVVSTMITLLLAIWLDLLPKKNYFKLSVIIYFGWLLKEILMSSIAVVKIAFRKNLKIQPSLELINTAQKNTIGIVTYANSITLTPGTVTLSTKDNHLLVHALDISFMDDLKSGQMDRKVKEIIK